MPHDSIDISHDFHVIISEPVSIIRGILDFVERSTGPFRGNIKDHSVPTLLAWLLYRVAILYSMESPRKKKRFHCI